MPNSTRRTALSTALRLSLAGFATTGVLLLIAGLVAVAPSAHAADASTVLPQQWQIPENGLDATAADPTGTLFRRALVALRSGRVQEAADVPDRKPDRTRERRPRRRGAVTEHHTAKTHPRPAPPRAIQLDARTLSRAMGGTVPLARYKELLPAFNRALAAAHCNTVRRVAMFCAQVGHESLGLRYMEEIASGSAYNWRADLGNTHPGDGHRFKGRGPIQITGRANYRKVSEWAHHRGIVPTRDYFVDHPARLASDRHGFDGVVWYWTRARNMNAYADHNNIVGATMAINGGTNGLGDRVARWHHCLKMGRALLGKSGPHRVPHPSRSRRHRS